MDGKSVGVGYMSYKNFQRDDLKSIKSFDYKNKK